MPAFCVACSADGGDTGADDVFEQGDDFEQEDDENADDGFDEMDGLTELPDVNVSRLCAESDDPDGAEDQIWIDCRIETGLLGSSSPAPASASATPRAGPSSAGASTSGALLPAGLAVSFGSYR